MTVPDALEAAIIAKWSGGLSYTKPSAHAIAHASVRHRQRPDADGLAQRVPVYGADMLLGSWGAVCSLGSPAPLGKDPRVARVGGSGLRGPWGDEERGVPVAPLKPPERYSTVQGQVQALVRMAGNSPVAADAISFRYSDGACHLIQERSIETRPTDPICLGSCDRATMSAWAATACAKCCAMA